MADRSKQILNLYKGTEKIQSGKAGELTTTLTGLAADTVVALGDYKVSFTEGALESAKVDVPTFTVTAA